MCFIVMSVNQMLVLNVFNLHGRGTLALATGEFDKPAQYMKCGKEKQISRLGIIWKLAIFSTMTFPKNKNFFTTSLLFHEHYLSIICCRVADLGFQQIFGSNFSRQICLF